MLKFLKKLFSKKSSKQESQPLVQAKLSVPREEIPEEKVVNSIPRKNYTRLAVGTRVKWKSQSSGFTTTKIGVIVAVVPPWVILESFDFDWSKYRKPEVAMRSYRKEESYLVEVKVGVTDKAKKAIYWPYAENLVPV